MTVIDPVCGKRVGLDHAVAQEDHGDWAYFFCSDRCHTRFRQSPNRFAHGPENRAGATPSETYTR